MSMQWIKRFFVAFIMVLIFFTLRHVAHTNFSFEFFKQHALLFRVYVQDRYWLSLSIYLSVFIASVFFAIPITAALTIMAGWLFGMWWGALYATSAATVGNLLFFFTVRYGMQRFNMVDMHNNYLQRLIPRLTWSMLLLIHLLPFTHTPLVAIAANIAGIDWVTFIWTLYVGIIPGTLVYTWAGNKIYQIKSVSDLSSVMAVVIIFSVLLFVLGMIVKRLFNHNAHDLTE